MDTINTSGPGQDDVRKCVIVDNEQVLTEYQQLNILLFMLFLVCVYYVIANVYMFLYQLII